MKRQQAEVERSCIPTARQTAHYSQMRGGKGQPRDFMPEITNGKRKRPDYRPWEHGPGIEMYQAFAKIAVN